MIDKPHTLIIYRKSGSIRKEISFNSILDLLIYKRDSKLCKTNLYDIEDENGIVINDIGEENPESNIFYNKKKYK